MAIVENENFLSAVIDALSSHICVTDQDGVIVTVNRAWQKFAAENPPISGRTGVGVHYIKICESASGPGSDGAEEFAQGVRSVLDGKADLFLMEYPCHSPTEYRWYLGRVTPLKAAKGGAVISHMTITERKLLELELIRLAGTDSLTGLSNRRHFLAIAALELERVKRFGAQASVVMVDLDHFKAVNDEYGHAAGDEALRCLAQVCKRQLRQIDTIARMGGEEFVLLLPGTKETGAAIIAETVRCALSETLINDGRNRFGLTASFGVAEARPSDEAIAECLDRADSALYSAKRVGRNCVMRFTEILLAEER